MNKCEGCGIVTDTHTHWPDDMSEGDCIKCCVWCNDEH